MSLRRRSLPRGWYPDDPDTLRSLVKSWTLVSEADVASGARGREADANSAVAAVAPHAGWTFSGRLAALAVASLLPGGAEPPSTVAIFGGHLPPGASPLAARESSFDTPLGVIDADLELLASVEASIALGSDLEPDNTVEVLLPMVAMLFPGSRVLWLRAPNDSASLDLGSALFSAAYAIGRRVACLGSTDLTHYGPNYGFSPKGRGAAAEAWVRGTNDKRFVDALLALDEKRALSLAEAERSACSPGAAAAALAFARAAGATGARLLGYATSLDLRPDDSFVGYSAIAFHKESA